jgi:hypothetical protein
MLKWIGLAVVGLLLAVLLLASMKPDAFRVERSVNIKAPADRILAEINDFHRWRGWSPWESRDPNMKTSYSGAAAGPGAVYEWEGNSAVGKGRMEILDSSASAIRIKLDFAAPMEAHNTAEFTAIPSGDSTDVTWAMYGANSFVGKIIQLFVSMDSMVGGDFEKGLTALKALAEK